MAYAFIKNNIVETICIFESQNEELVDSIAQEQGFDDAVWVGENKPALYSSYDGKKFTAPTLDYLYERGASSENSAMRAERLAKIAETDSDQ